MSDNRIRIVENQALCVVRETKVHGGFLVDHDSGCSVPCESVQIRCHERTAYTRYPANCSDQMCDDFFSRESLETPEVWEVHL